MAAAAALATRLPRYGPRFSEIKSLEEDNFLQFAGFRVLQVPRLWCEGKQVERFGG